MVMEHEGRCTVYDPEFELKVVGYRNPVAAGDIEVGDFVQHPASGDWGKIYSTWVNEGGDAYLFSADATAAEVAQARRDACEGHETIRGAIGDTYFCDGSCA